MSMWAEVRKQARLRHAELFPAESQLVSAETLIEAAQQKTEIQCKGAPPDDPLLDGAAATYNRILKRIYYSNETDSNLAAFHIAHEFGHHWLDIAEINCEETDIDPTTPAEPEMSLVGEADAYSPKERAEAQANLFAREFLLPREKLRAHYLQKAATAKDIAILCGVPEDLVRQQLADSLLLPTELDQETARGPEPDPDETQLKAINTDAGPHRVRASPGTGKTRTLIGRVKKLILEDHVGPKSILVLTYSNLAAQDLALRLHAAIGEASVLVWSSTFHAYGFELLRKFYVEAGYKKEPRLIDRAGTLSLLEELLPQLNLQHYFELHDPIAPLRTIAALISRAKDEIASPERYAELAQAMLNSDDETERAAGARAMEVANAYKLYEEAMRAKDLVDFGDLIARPIELFRKKPAVRDSARLLRSHILVDEYQDMNRASAVLLQDLVSPVQGPWVVGDMRQSIYRFRGASPVNMSRFEADFPGTKTTDLGVNYRSGGGIVRAFEAFGAGMASGEKTAPLNAKPHRGENTGRIDYEIAATPASEFNGIGHAITDLAASDAARFCDQVVIARSHTTLARLASHLEHRGIPCLYFGDFFERPEVCDMLSLLSFVSEMQGIGFYRVAQFPRYDAPHSDIEKVVAWRREQKISMLEAVRKPDQIPGLSDTGRDALQRLIEDTQHAEFAISPHRFLSNYIFGDARHLDDLLKDESVQAQQRRLALYQLLQFAFSFRALPKSDSKRAFLAHIRRLEILDEEKQLRQMPTAAAGIDAVRMMTVHASKGLEFPVVHMPYLTNRHFPVNRTNKNPPPPGLIEDDDLLSREAEEQSLFFVAMSRAEDNLRLSRAICHGGGAWKNLGPSPYLGRVAAHLPRSNKRGATWNDEDLIVEESKALEAKLERSEWPVRAIETYLNCPRQFYYAEILELGGDDVTPPYVPFHIALHSSIARLREIPALDERRQSAAKSLAAEWDVSLLRGHRLETLYRTAAEGMIRTAVDLLEGKSLDAHVSISLDGGVTINCRVDHVGESDGQIVIQRLKANRLARRETPKARYFVAQAALREQFAGAPVKFEHASLLDGTRREATTTSTKLQQEIQKLEEALAKIAEGRFETAPNEYHCPRCPYFFVCPSHGPILPPK